MFKNLPFTLVFFITILFILFGSCKKEQNTTPIPEKPLLKGWHNSTDYKVWIEELEEYAMGSFLRIINFRNDSCLVVIDAEFKLISDTTKKWSASYNLKAPVETIGQFSKIGSFLPAGSPQYLYLPEDIWTIDSTQGDTLYFWPTICWTQISGTPHEVVGGSFYYTKGESYHRIYNFTADSLIAFHYNKPSTEIPTGNWSEIIKLPLIYSENSYQLLWIDSTHYCNPTTYIFHDNLWITSFNDLRVRILLDPYIKK